MVQTDNEALVGCITKCFTLAMDGAVPLPRQQELLALGKRLRGSLINLLTVSFDDTAHIKDLNQKIADANKQLEEALADIAKIPDTVKKVNKLVGALDGALQFAIGLAL